MSAKQAVHILQAQGLDVELTDYGFRMFHEELNNRVFADCGMDNDSSISMSLHTREDPPVVWFFRKDFIEMAKLIVQAYQETGQSAPSRDNIIESMRKLDALYDDTELGKMTDNFLSGIENA